MSYMFGPHMQVEKNGILFGGDTRIVYTPSNKIELKTNHVPSWLVADWLLAKSRGEPISHYAQAILNQPDCWNDGLKWLDTFIN